MAYFHSSVFIILTFSAALQKKECLGSSNIALGKDTNSTVALSGHPEWNSTTTVDGNTNQNLYCGPCLHTQQTPNIPAFLTVDLGKLHTISRIEIYFVKYTSQNCTITVVNQEVKNRSVKYSLKISNNSSTPGTLCYQDKTNNATAFNLTQSQKCLGTGRYVSIVQTKKSNGTGVTGPILEVCEFKVYGCKTGSYGPNCSLSCPTHCVNNFCDPDNGTCLSGCTDGLYGPYCSMQQFVTNETIATSGSSLFQKWNASKTIDGCINTNVFCDCCLHTDQSDGKNPEYLTIDLQHVYTINRVEILFVHYNGPTTTCVNQAGQSHEVQKRSKGYEISISKDAQLGELCYTDRTTNALSFDLHQYNTCTGRGRYINITQSNKSDGYGPILEICEVKVYGCVYGYYGDDCQYICPEQCKGNVCDLENGTCINGCNTGWQGQNCSECSETTYGTYCNISCGYCENGNTCDSKTGQCPNATCQPGFNGILCKEKCPNGTYGKNCSSHCGHCKESVTCHFANGTCPCGNCDLGYEGPLCKIACIDQTYGYNCNESCGHCRDNRTCDTQNGSCTDGLCDKGYNGSLCNQECPNGTYGYNCLNTCGQCRNDNACNKKEGECPKALCERGFNGSLCNETCSEWTYGYNCNETCGQCRNDTCDTKLGNCTGGLCDRGYNGSLCSEKCPEGRYGYNCNATCGTCKGYLPCNKRDGTCENDECERGLHGSLCKEKCQNGTYGYNCKSKCENCIEELCNIYNGSCVNDGCKPGFKGPLCDIAKERLDQPLQVDNSPYIGGGVAGTLVVLVVAAVLFLWRRKLSKMTNAKEEEEFSDLGTSSGSSMKNRSQIDSGVYTSIKKRETYIDDQSKSTNDIQLDQQYENVRLGKHSNKTYEMSCSTLADSVKEKENNENKLFKEEFEALPKGQLKPCEAAQMSPNRPKNRFKTTFPYDDTRIVLKTHGDDESDYINANYIKDTNGSSTYIASQGPRTHTVIDMWRMIWQEKISSIVMLTNLQEKRSEKCAKYWPDLNCTITYGNISIKTQKEKDYSNFTIRIFHIVNMKENLSREVTHYHYTTWPDHSVPESIDLVLFHHKVQRDALSPNKKTAPLLVHCSAGIGRTGTFIALDALLKPCRDEHSVNVFQFVKHMREEERMNMIQTVDQYIVIHYLLLEALRTTFYPIPKSNFEEEVKLMCSSAKPANQSVLRQQISELNDLKPNYSDDDFTRGLQNQELNVDPNILPIDRYMLYLTTFVKGRNDYINAVTVPTQTRLHAIVVTNHPKDNTIVDLIRLLLDHGSCVVELSGDISFNQWYPAPVSTNTYDPFEVERSELKVSATANVTESDITIIQKKDTTPHTFRLFETEKWPSGSSDVSGLKTLCGLVRSVMTWSGNSTNGKIVLISKDGVSRCDVFCAVYNALEQLDLDDEVDMFNIVRQLQIRRPQFIPAVEAYKLCFDAVSCDLESNNEAIYANV